MTCGAKTDAGDKNILKLVYLFAGKIFISYHIKILMEGVI